jgi:Ca2+-transporting ATPase
MKQPLTPSNEIIWYQLGAEQAFKLLATDSNGLTTAEARARLEKYGYNELKVKKQSPFIRFLRQFHNALLYVLIVAAIVTFFLGHFTDMYVIIGVVLATVIIGFIQEGKAEASLEALKKMMIQESNVIRDGEQKIIATKELVPGDVVVLEGGHRVPADLRLFESKNLSVDEAMLTGESVPADKGIDAIGTPNLPPADQTCMAFSGTFITRGHAKATVVKTGKQTEIGKIAGMMLETKRAVPPIIKKVAEFTKFLIITIVSFGAIVFGIGLALGYEWNYMFLAVVSMIVALIPEGLPAALISAFAIGAMHMARRNALIRILPAVESLGCTTVICSDKTGTLTKNEMTVVRIYSGDRDYEVTGVGYHPSGEFFQDDNKINPAQETRELAETLAAGHLCNNAALDKNDSDYRIKGDPTEGALLVSAVKAGIVKNLPRLDSIPFEPEQRYMATLHQAEDNIIYIKGSPETVLRMCSNQLMDGEIKPLESERILAKAHEMASDALRVLAMAYKDVDKAKKTLSPQDMEDLTFLGLQGMIDSPREEAIEAVRKCKKAGIRPVMITGDHAETAKAIAWELEIGDANHRTLIGEELSRMSDDELCDVVDDISVYARVAPEHKLRITKQLQRRGHIVAVTGDGVNDAPALKTADIGVAMGMTGTEVSKEASEMILTDDNFASIVSAVEEGRHVFNNIWKVILFLLPTNGGQGLAMAGAVLLSPFIAVFALGLPIQPVQILWVNLIIAIACAIPLIWEPMEEGILEKPPRDPKERLFNPLFLRRVGLVSVVEMVGTFTMFLLFYRAMGSSEQYLAQAQTIAFTTIILMGSTYLFTARSITTSAFTYYSPLKNKRLLLGWAITIGLQLMIVYSLPLFGVSPFRTEPFPAVWWIPLILIAPAGFFAVELEKLLRRRFVGLRK